MRAKQIAVLIATPVMIFAVSVGLFLLLARPGQADAAAPPAYILGAQDGRAALFKSGAVRYFSEPAARSGRRGAAQRHPRRHANGVKPLFGGFRRIARRKSRAKAPRPYARRTLGFAFAGGEKGSRPRGGLPISPFSRGRFPASSHLGPR